MDPVAALLAITDTTRSLDDRAEHATALLGWLDGGGFAPVPDVDAIRAALADLRRLGAVDLPWDVELRSDHHDGRATCLAALLAVILHRPAEPEPEPQYAVHKLMICADCALYHANGDLPEGRDLQGDIDRTWDGTGSVVRFSVDTGPGEEFSAARCGSCGSRLAGERHPATAIVFE